MASAIEAVASHADDASWITHYLHAHGERKKTRDRKKRETSWMEVLGIAKKNPRQR